MSREAILALLASDAGLDAGSLGQRVIDHALQDACREAGVADEFALWGALQARPALLRQVREHFLVPETWFFRAPAQFADLARFATGVAARRRPFRVLSLPCASGEEAVSAAIALQQAGLLAASMPRQACAGMTPAPTGCQWMATHAGCRPACVAACASRRATRWIRSCCSVIPASTRSSVAT